MLSCWFISSTLLHNAMRKSDTFFRATRYFMHSVPSTGIAHCFVWWTVRIPHPVHRKCMRPKMHDVFRYINTCSKQHGCINKNKVVGIYFIYRNVLRPILVLVIFRLLFFSHCYSYCKLFRAIQCDTITTRYFRVRSKADTEPATKMWDKRENKKEMLRNACIGNIPGSPWSQSWSNCHR